MKRDGTMDGLSFDQCVGEISRPTWFSVDLDTVASNFRDMRMIVGDLVKIAAVLKADAYGHGALMVADTLFALGVNMFAVATLDEALELRSSFPSVQVLVMGYIPEACAGRVVENRITPTVFSLGFARALSRAALMLSTTVPIHIKLDTGMNRLGIKAYEDPVSLMETIAGLPGIEIEGVFTHLALRDRESDQAQFALFQDIIGNCGKIGLKTGLHHVCDSIGTVRYPEFRLDMVRVGAALFGVRPNRMGPEYDAYQFPPAGSFVTHIARIRRLRSGEMVSYDSSWKAPKGGTLVATLPVGYADGYPRRFGNKAQVSIHSGGRLQRAPVVGLVCMDQTMVDVGGVEQVAEGDEVVLLGGGEIGFQEASDWGGTNRNELLCSIGRRVPRVYLSDGSVVAIDNRLGASTLKRMR
ncbi:MAG: alanine racemase [Spirochaetaceae bacterium]|nr:alanine racemase [Spirochaetaceae bacterium]